MVIVPNSYLQIFRKQVGYIAMIRKQVTAKEITKTIEQIEYITTDGRSWGSELDAVYHQNYLDYTAKYEAAREATEKLSCYNDYLYLVESDDDLENVRVFESADQVENKKTYPNFTTFYAYNEYDRVAVQFTKADLIKMLEMLD
jgi:hypothetical protein